MFEERCSRRPLGSGRAGRRVSSGATIFAFLYRYTVSFAAPRPHKPPTQSKKKITEKGIITGNRGAGLDLVSSVERGKNRADDCSNQCLGQGLAESHSANATGGRGSNSNQTQFVSNTGYQNGLYRNTGIAPKCRWRAEPKF